MAQTNVSRREVVRAGSVAVAAGLAGCMGGFGGRGGSMGPDHSGESDGSHSSDESTDDTHDHQSFDGWLSNVENYDGVVDETGRDAVTVAVGVENGAGAYGYGPAAVRVSTGTQVTFEWTGRGSSHNVVARDERFESELTDAEGHTFDYTFESTGTVPYYCTPHQSLGMKGVVVVE